MRRLWGLTGRANFKLRTCFAGCEPVFRLRTCTFRMIWASLRAWPTECWFSIADKSWKEPTRENCSPRLAASRQAAWGMKHANWLAYRGNSRDFRRRKKARPNSIYDFRCIGACVHHDRYGSRQVLGGNKAKPTDFPQHARGTPGRIWTGPAARSPLFVLAELGSAGRVRILVCLQLPCLAAAQSARGKLIDSDGHRHATVMGASNSHRHTRGYSCRSLARSGVCSFDDLPAGNSGRSGWTGVTCIRAAHSLVSNRRHAHAHE